MGKASKKMTKKKNQQQANEMVKVNRDLQEKLARQIEEMQYDDALETLSVLIENKCYEPQVIYQGAQTYFLMGDYERAASWVNNTLHYAPEHIGARLLLARICLLEDRNDDAMALYDFVLKNYGTMLTEADKDDIKEAADYILRTEKEWLTENYPEVAGFLGATAETPERNVVKAEQLMADVLAKDISLLEKIEILNTFAGGLYIEEDFAGAVMLLEKALTIDKMNEMTLRNLAMAEKARGNEQKAMNYAARLKHADFMLLNMLS